MLKAVLTLTYEKKIKRRDVRAIKDAISYNDDQLIDELFGVGYDSPIDTEVAFYDGDKVLEDE